MYIQLIAMLVATKVLLFVSTFHQAHLPEPSARWDSTESRDETFRFEHDFAAMGVRFRVTGYAHNQRQFDEARGAIEQRVSSIEKSLSDYDANSEIRKIAISAPHNDPVAASDILCEICRTSGRLNTQTEGAFDPTIGPLSSIWRLARKRNRLPDEQEIATAMQSVGWNKLRITDDQRIQLSADSMQLDFGGIAKGYAADQAIGICSEHGIVSALVDAGGDIRVSAAPPGKAGWLIAIDNSSPTPADDPAAHRRVLCVADRGVATSGDAKQRLVKHGQVYSHIIDPRSGNAVRNSCSVTVVADTAATADALASAITVLGRTRGLAVASELDGVEAMLECPSAGAPSANAEKNRLSTSGFADYVASESIADPAAGFRDRFIDEKDH